MKNLKLILLLATGVLGSQILGMQSVRNHWKKGAVAATAALTYGAHIQQENDLKQAVKNLPSLNRTAAADLRKSLISSLPNEVDQDKLGKIKFKKIYKPSFPIALDVDGNWTIVSGSSILSKEGWSDFAYLHQVARLNNKDGESNSLRCAVGGACLHAGMVYYFLNNPSFKRGLAAVPLYCVGALGFQLINNLAGYRAERRADEFAIQALKEQRNAQGLAHGAVELVISSAMDAKDKAVFGVEEKYPFLAAALNGGRSRIRRSARLAIEAAALESADGTEQVSKTSDSRTMV